MNPAVPALLARVHAALPTPSFDPVALLVRRETDLSRLIAWMLDPRGSHGAGPAFLQSFLALSGISAPADLHRARVELEAARRVGKRLFGRVDIQITHPGFILLVENKPFAGFGNAQLERYVSSLSNDARTGRVVALLGRGWSDDALRRVVPAGAVAVRLGIEIRDWVGACAAHTDGRVRQFLEAFRDNLNEQHGGMRLAEVDRVIDQMLDGPEAVAAAAAVIEARDRFATRLCQDFSARVAVLAKAAGLNGLRPVDDEAPLFGGAKSGTLRLDIGLADFDVALEAEATYFRDISFCISSRRKVPRIERVHAELVRRLRAALGEGSGEPLVDWYAWWDWVDALHSSGSAPADGPNLWAWAADASDDGLAARFVSRAAEIKQILDL